MRLEAFFRKTLNAAPIVFVGILASWYLWYGIGARVGLPAWLALGGTVLTVIIVATTRARVASRAKRDPQRHCSTTEVATAQHGSDTPNHRTPPSRESLILSILAVALILATLAGLPLMAVAVAVAAFAGVVIALATRHLPTRGAVRPPAEFTPIELAVAWACALALGVLAAVVNRPDLDDAYFGAVAAHVGATGDLGTTGTPYGGPMGPPLHNPLLNPWEQFVGTLGFVSGIDTAVVYWVILPPLLAVVAGLGIAFAAREFGFRRLTLALPAVVVFLILDGSVHAGVGNLHFARLWQGKVVLAAVVIPIVFALTARAIRDTTRWNVFLVAVALIGALVTTDTAIMLVPPLAAVIAIALLAQRFGRRAIAIAAPIAAILALGIFVLGWVAGSDTSAPSSAALAYVLGGSTHTALYIAIITLGLLTAASPVYRILLAGAVMVGFLFAGPLKPGLVALYANADPIIWRFLWIVPITIMIASLGTDRYGRTRAHGRRALTPALAVIAIAIVATGSLVWSPANGARIAGVTEWKLPPTEAAAAAAIRGVSKPGDLILAPTSVMDAITASTGDLDVVSGRYVSGLLADPTNAQGQRDALRAAIDGGQRPRAGRGSALETIEVDLVCAWDANQLADLGKTPESVGPVSCVRLLEAQDPA